MGCLVEGEAARAEGAEVASRRRRATTRTVAVDEVERERGGGMATVSRSLSFFLQCASLFARRRSSYARTSAL